MNEPIKMIVQLYEVKSRKDGGGRLVLEFGAESMAAATDLMKINANQESLFALALMPVVDSDNHDGNNDHHEGIDPETGEVLL